MIFPQDPLYPLGPFQIFPKIRGDICKSRCTTGMNDTSGKFAASINDNKFSTGIKDTNFATIFVSVGDTGDNYRWQMMATISGG
jgi:hypothetical protein